MTEAFRPRGKPPPHRTTIPPRSDYRDRRRFLTEVLRAYNGDRRHRPMTIQEIADILGVSWSVARRYLVEAGAVFRGRGPDKDKEEGRRNRRTAKGLTDDSDGG